ncbi:MAG: L-glyceraldehyde 3-phosphate reductase [Mediterranea massiliensis]|nr:L-glyceraldehyde 3-phosphate reductase [Mediterranea massiliensis]
MINPVYFPKDTRYDGTMKYRRCGRSGILLPAISLGLWHNFGDVDPLQRSFDIVHHAFDNGITHFDLANNYGPSAGSAEESFGQIIRKSLKPYRDELFISTKAGYLMWDGPYGEWGSRKYLISSLDQSLRRMNLDYVDLFYSHRYDPNTPLEETMQALVDVVRQGKALYVGISNYPLEAAAFAYQYLKERDVPCLLYQGRYNMLNREPEVEGILQQAKESGSGFIAFSPLAQGLLTDRYLNGIPEDSRIARGGFLKKEALTDETMQKIMALNKIAQNRGQSLAEMALAWLLKDDLVTSVIVGASSVAQLDKNLKAVNNLAFDAEELKLIEEILSTPKQ